MTIRKVYYLHCSQCSKAFGDWHNGGECKRDLRDASKLSGWKYRKVQNGSFWDFCPKCIAKNNKSLQQASC